MSLKGVSDRLAGHDLVVVIGAEVFRCYTYVAGDDLPEGTELLHVTDDPAVAGAARVGDRVLGDPKLSIEFLTQNVGEGSERPGHRRCRARGEPEKTELS
ncbi:hypothetical protein [Streptomyces sp. NPDC059861]|uniref:hypothetical protein n=1 Tax=Streptomyces sp. NPDC059861 TaxID=3346974 RepID=UPI00364FE124